MKWYVHLVIEEITGGDLAGRPVRSLVTGQVGSIDRLTERMAQTCHTFLW